MKIDLTGMRAIICGSTQGIGKAVARELALLGAQIILVARNEEKLRQVKMDLSAAKGQQHRYLIADFSDPGQVKDVITQYLSTAQPVHILVNNAGGPPAGPILGAAVEEFLAAFNAHLVCNHILAQAVVPGMKRVGYGRIINILSTSIREPIPDLGVSNTVRAAVASWAKTLAGELGSFGITVNNVLPGSTQTKRLHSLIESRARRSGKSVDEMTQQIIEEIPARRFAEPEEIAYAVAFLASPAAAYITGVSLTVDGGRLRSL